MISVISFDNLFQLANLMNSNTPRYYDLAGLSTDTKPTECATGSKFTEVDTGNVYLFDSESGTWIYQFSYQKLDRN